MCGLALKTLILRELVLEAHRQIVQLALLIEDHLEVELVDIAPAIFNQIYYLLVIRLLCVHLDGREVFHVS